MTRPSMSGHAGNMAQERHRGSPVTASGVALATVGGGGVIALGQSDLDVTVDGQGPLGRRHEEICEGDVESNTPSSGGGWWVVCRV